MKDDNQFVVGGSTPQAPVTPVQNPNVANGVPGMNMIYEEPTVVNQEVVQPQPSMAAGVVMPQPDMTTGIVMDNSSNAEYTYEEPANNDSKRKWVIIILLGVFLLGLFGFIGYKWYQNKQYQDWMQKIKDAAREHVDQDIMVSEQVLQTADGDNFKIYIKDLIADGHLQSADLINPKTKKKISACNFVELRVSGGQTVTYVNVTVNNKTCPNDKGQTETKPTIVLNGEATVRMKVNDSYMDAGAKAYDADGTDITDQLQVTNSVNTKVVGEYSVTYNVKNSAGKSAEPVTRAVIVEAKGGTVTPKPPVTGGDRTNPVIRGINIPATITVGDTLNYSLVFSDNSRLKTITYCTPGCNTESVSGTSVAKARTFTTDNAGLTAITASATDASGNKVYYNATITVLPKALDRTSPTVTLVGQLPTNVTSGSTVNISVKFSDNVGIKEYYICVTGKPCLRKTLIAQATSVTDTLSVTLTTGTYSVTAGATDTSGNAPTEYSGNKSLGNIVVTAGAVATMPTVRLVSMQVGTTTSPNLFPMNIGQTATITVNYKDPEGVVNYLFCSQINGVNTCKKEVLATPDIDRLANHTFTPTAPGTYTLTASTNDATGLYSGNIKLGTILVNPGLV